MEAGDQPDTGADIPAAVVLCGGESRRMGQSKAWLPFGPERLLERVVRLAGSAAHPVVVVAAPRQELPGLPADVTVVRDPVPGRGPLAGLATGLAALPENVEFVYATSTDVPFLEPRWISRLVELIGAADVAIPRIDGRLHPLAALYRKPAALPAALRLLDAGDLRLTSLAGAITALFLDECDLRGVDPELRTLCNLNRPEDHAAALRMAGFAD